MNATVHPEGTRLAVLELQHQAGGSPRPPEPMIASPGLIGLGLSLLLFTTACVHGRILDERSAPYVELRDAQEDLAAGRAESLGEIANVYCLVHGKLGWKVHPPKGSALFRFR